MRLRRAFFLWFVHEFRGCRELANRPPEHRAVFSVAGNGLDAHGCSVNVASNSPGSRRHAW